MNIEASHPKTHMMTNIYVDEHEETVTMNFRIVALLGKGLVVQRPIMTASLNRSRLASATSGVHDPPSR